MRKTASDAGIFDVRDFGAEGVARATRELVLTNLRERWISYPAGTKAVVRHPLPGKRPDADGIQAAIDAAHAAGGGTVVVPAGDYAVAPIRLRGRVRLHLQPGARLWGSPELDDYRRQESLIVADGEENVAITGEGEIHGQSPAWIIPWMNEDPSGWERSLRGRRPGRMIAFTNCRHVRVEGVRLHDSPNWTLVFKRCAHVAVHDIFMRHFDVVNADGIDVVDSQNVVISGCDLHVTDDGICLKNDATLADPPGVRNVTVTNCVIRTWCNGVKIGTESSGRFENIAFSNIVVHNPDDDLKGAEGGIHIALCDGGHVRNVAFRNFVMSNVECPFYLVVTPRRSKQQAYREPRPGTIERVALSGIQADGFCRTPFVVGCPDSPIRDVSLADIRLRRTAGFTTAPRPEPVPPSDQQYPTPYMFATAEGGRRDLGDGLPAHGLYLRDVAGARIRDFAVLCAAADARPLFVAERCTDVEFTGGRERRE
jgi:polygalacturonase